MPGSYWSPNTVVLTHCGVAPKPVEENLRPQISMPFCPWARSCSVQTIMNVPSAAAATFGLEQRAELVFTSNSPVVGTPVALKIRAYTSTLAKPYEMGLFVDGGAARARCCSD